MGFFDDISNIDPAGGGGNRLGAGHYKALRITGCSIAQGFHGTRFVAEFDVLESTGPSATAPGESGSWTARIDGTWAKIGLGEVKSFVAAALGTSPDDVAAVNALVTSALMRDVTEMFRPLADEKNVGLFTEIDFDMLDDKAMRRLFVGATRATMKLTLVVSEASAAVLKARLAQG